MRMDGTGFLGWRRKAITLLGMSGVGKTTLANRLPKSNWFHFSGDYRIGTKYLEEPILDNVKTEAMQCRFLRELLRSDSIYIASNITIHNLELIATFLGKIGDPAKGGLSLAEFNRRQRLHREAEIAAMRDVAEFIGKSRRIYGYDHFVNDAGGSVCELGDPATIELLAAHTLIVYLRAGEEMEEQLIARAVASPKPLYYGEAFLESSLAKFLAQEDLESDVDIDPDRFVRWMFPRLVAHRRPLYAAIAEKHGYTLDAAQVEYVRDEQDFLELVASCLRASEAA